MLKVSIKIGGKMLALAKRYDTSPEKTCHPKEQAMRSTEPGASNLLSLQGIRRRESTRTNTNTSKAVISLSV